MSRISCSTRVFISLTVSPGRMRPSLTLKYTMTPCGRHTRSGLPGCCLAAGLAQSAWGTPCWGPPAQLLWQQLFPSPRGAA